MILQCIESYENMATLKNRKGKMNPEGPPEFHSKSKRKGTMSVSLVKQEDEDAVGSSDDAEDPLSESQNRHGEEDFVGFSDEIDNPLSPSKIKQEDDDAVDFSDAANDMSVPFNPIVIFKTEPEIYEDSEEPEINNDSDGEVKYASILDSADSDIPRNHLEMQTNEEQLMSDVCGILNDQESHLKKRHANL